MLAGDPRGTSDKTGFRPVVPCKINTQYNATARRRFAIGPAETIAIRLKILWRLKARFRSSALNVNLSDCERSRSSSIFTKPPKGNTDTMNSVSSFPIFLLKIGRPNPKENLSTLTPQHRAI